MTVSENRVGLVLGVLVGGWHLLWSLLVAVHAAQSVIDFVFWMHFLKPVLVVEGFSIHRAVVLLAVTTAAGYAVGFVGGVLWNRVFRPA